MQITGPNVIAFTETRRANSYYIANFDGLLAKEVHNARLIDISNDIVPLCCFFGSTLKIRSKAVSSHGFI